MFSFQIRNFFAFALAAVNASGCTAINWARAISPNLTARQVEGALVDRSTKPPTMRAVVISYIADLNSPAPKKLYVLIPIASDGRPLPPFECSRCEKRYGATAPVDAAQRQAILKLRSDERAFEDAERAVRSSCFVPLFHPGGVSSLTGSVTQGDGIAFFQYWPTVASGPTLPKDLTETLSLPSTTHTVLVPWFQPRPKHDRVTDTAITALMTPFALAGDAFIVPAAAIAWETGIGFRDQ